VHDPSWLRRKLGNDADAIVRGMSNDQIAAFLAAGKDFSWNRCLPFTWDITAHRKELRDYCFWGGPDTTTPFPTYDRHEPDDFVKPDGFEKHHFG
jgi:hypothetical protein